jgi:hypothetical protein
MMLSAENRQRIERLLAQVDFPQGGTAEVRKHGYLWTRTTRTKLWHRAVRMRGGPSQVRAAAQWLKEALQARASTP